MGESMGMEIAVLDQDGNDHILRRHGRRCEAMRYANSTHDLCIFILLFNRRQDKNSRTCEIILSLHSHVAFGMHAGKTCTSLATR
jgi:hypothetical protein